MYITTLKRYNCEGLHKLRFKTCTILLWYYLTFEISFFLIPFWHMQPSIFWLKNMSITLSTLSSLSLWIFGNANVNSPHVLCKYALTRLRVERLLSAALVVTEIVANICRSVDTFGGKKLFSRYWKASTHVFGHLIPYSHVFPFRWFKLGFHYKWRTFQKFFTFFAGLNHIFFYECWIISRSKTFQL